MRLIVDGAEGKSNNIGVVSFNRAMEIAEESQLDLVEVAPGADPPVCRIIDFSKYKYVADYSYYPNHNPKKFHCLIRCYICKSNPPKI